MKRVRRSTVLAAALLLLLAGSVAGWLFATKRLPKASAPTFRRVTFRSVFLNNARFTPDGQTVVYASQPAGGFKPALFAARPGSPESRPFDMEADILAVSSAGEMAVLIDQNPLFGTLARVPFAGGVPRPAVEGVPYAGADWSPDGKNLAIVRVGPARNRVEFPVGKVLYEGAVGALRFSPRGDRIAFHERGSIKVVGSSGGAVQTVTSGWVEFPGGAPCWRPDGKEVWFSGTREPGRPSGLHAVDLQGHVRLVAQMPGELELDDISRDGRVLLAHHTLIGEMRALFPGESAERDVTWLDQSVPFDMTTDGKMVFFNEIAEGGGTSEAVYLRRSDGTPAVRLGEGRGIALSPDESTVLVKFPSSADRFGLLPTGAGETRTLALAGFEEILGADWLPDGKAFLFSGRERGKKLRTYRFDLSEARFRPVSEEGVAFPPLMTGPVSPDGRWFLAARGAGKFARFPVDGGQPRPIAATAPREVPIRWSSDNRTIFTRRLDPFEEGKIFRLDPDTGLRTLVKTIGPPDRAANVTRIVLTPDGRGHAYSVRQVHSQLYVVEGLR